MQRVYIDTSVIGGCFDPEFAPWSAALMEEFLGDELFPVVSRVVERELLEAPNNVKKQYAELLSHRHELLEVTESALALARAYQDRKILTPKYYDDGLHIALATEAEVDVMVSWNFKHIVRFQKIKLFNAVNLEHGYKQLQIYSPREVASHEKRTRDDSA
ncbi:MAG: type II toxin-antitoxin system VapC family toxin [bacterium]|nr:type II toxin-antitoxin system VapC family toxin [bacterium]